MSLNPHHLELFHYVAKFGGIAQASKRMPYGVGQPAISLQISRLEDTLGVTLFERRPFKLTREGEKLAAHIAPFFLGLERLETELRGGAAPLLRVGATETVQRDHLPAVFDRLRDEHPGMRLALRDASPEALTELVRTGELDVAVFLTDGTPPADLAYTPLLVAHPVLLVPEAHPTRDAASILAPARIATPLVALHPSDPVCVAFRAYLAKRDRIWEPAIELGSRSIVHRYVESGYGVGLDIAIPGVPAPAGLRPLALPDAPPITVGILRAHNANPLRDAFVRLASAHAAALLAADAPPKKPRAARAK